MTITDAIVSIAALILIGFINYIIYRRQPPCSASPDQTV